MENQLAKTPTLETERLLLRPLTKKDAKEAYQNWTSDPEVTKFMLWSRHKSIQDTIDWLEVEEQNFMNENFYDFGFVIKQTGELIGSGGIVLSKNHGMFELGYNMMKKYWNQGYTTEAAERILTFGVEVRGIKRFIARHAKDNLFSGKVMEKVGFVYQKDGEYTTADQKKFSSREYLLVRE